VCRRIEHFPSISDEYLPKIVYRSLLVSLNIDAILELTCFQRGKKFDQVTGDNGLDDAYTATLTQPKALTGNRSVLGMKAQL